MADLNTISGSHRWLTLPLSNSADLTEIPRAIILDAAGSVKMSGSDGNPETFVLAASVIYDFQPRRVWSTGTDANLGIKGLF